MGIEKDGYLPPRDAVFNEIIKTCGEEWVKLTPEKEQMSYRLSKLHFLSFLKNEGADCMFALAQFHMVLRSQIISTLSNEAKDFINYYEHVNENQKSDSEGNYRCDS
jgi:hypothetical protein